MPKTRHKKQLNSYDEITRATVKQLDVTLADDEEDKYTCLQCTKFVDQVLQYECCSCQSIDDKMFAVLVEFNSLN